MPSIFDIIRQLQRGELPEGSGFGPQHPLPELFQPPEPESITREMQAPSQFERRPDEKSTLERLLRGIKRSDDDRRRELHAYDDDPLVQQVLSDIHGQDSWAERGQTQEEDRAAAEQARTLESRGMPTAGGGPSPARQEMLGNIRDRKLRLENRRKYDPSFEGRGLPTQGGFFAGGENLAVSGTPAPPVGRLTYDEMQQVGSRADAEFEEALTPTEEDYQQGRAEAMQSGPKRQQMTTLFDRLQGTPEPFEGGEDLLAGDRKYVREMMDANPSTRAYAQSGGHQGAIDRQLARTKHRIVANRPLSRGGGIHGVTGDPATAARRDRLMKRDLGDGRTATLLKPGDDVGVVDGRFVNVNPLRVPQGVLDNRKRRLAQRLAPIGGDPAIRKQQQANRIARAKKTMPYRSAKRALPTDSQADGRGGAKFKVMTQAEMKTQGYDVTTDEAAGINNMRRRAYDRGRKVRDRDRARMTPAQRAMADVNERKRNNPVDTTAQTVTPGQKDDDKPTAMTADTAAGY